MLRRGSGEVFRGEGILAITKGLLEAGVAYVGGYQGAPMAHLLDVVVQSADYLAELGVHVEACSNEASTAALVDEGGTALDQTLVQHGAPARPVIAQPIRWTPRRAATALRDGLSSRP